MTIEIVDFPINSMVDLSIVFCRFTRGYTPISTKFEKVFSQRVFVIWNTYELNNLWQAQGRNLGATLLMARCFPIRDSPKKPGEINGNNVGNLMLMWEIFMETYFWASYMIAADSKIGIEIWRIGLILVMR